MTERPAPVIHPETQFFWDAARESRLLLQRCTACNETYYPPRPFCPSCASRAVEPRPASGKATLYSYVISHMPAPGYEPPFAVAVVLLEEGVKMMCNIVDCPPEPEHLVLDMPLELVFEQRGDMAVPQFRPVAGGAA